jgi:hypothetical protein
MDGADTDSGSADGDAPALEAARDLTPTLIDRLPEILDTVRLQLADDSPDYADFLAVDRQEVVRAAEVAIRRLVRATRIRMSGGLGEAPPEVQDALFEAIGRLQYREGNDLPRLLSAYQVGARAAWRCLSATALALGESADTIAELAESLFLFVDQLSAASARGYVREQYESAAERERLREELAAGLLSDRADWPALKLAAQRARWPLPSHACLILIDPEDELGRLVVSRLGPTALSLRWNAWLATIWPVDPGPGRRDFQERALRGARAVVVGSVPLGHLPDSAQVAGTAARLRGDGVLVEDLLFVEDHLEAIIVHRDPGSLRALREQVLAPLQQLPEATRERLTETLASWLRNLGDRRAVAAELHIHPQTVRYRLGQLRELFGEALDDPNSRVRLTVALVGTGRR